MEKHMLSGRQRFQLGALVTESYTDSKQSDPDFAKMATARLGFPVTPSNVSSVRKDLDIKSNYFPSSPVAVGQRFENRLAALEAQMRSLQLQLGVIKE